MDTNSLWVELPIVYLYHLDSHKLDISGKIWNHTPYDFKFNRPTHAYHTTEVGKKVDIYFEVLIKIREGESKRFVKSVDPYWIGMCLVN